MVAELKPQAREITKTSVSEWVQEYIDGGMEPKAAAEAVCAEIQRDGLLTAFFEAFGQRAIYECWQANNRMARPSVIGRDYDPGDHTPTIRVLPPAEMSRQRRVHDPKPLTEERSLLEAQWKVGDQWYRLGDMDVALCKAAGQHYVHRAKANATYARFFKALTDSLGAGQTVCQKYDHTALMALYKQAEAA